MDTQLILNYLTELSDNNNREWYLEYPIMDKDLFDITSFVPKAIEVFNTMKPFNDYLNKALTGFKMPAR